MKKILILTVIFALLLSFSLVPRAAELNVVDFATTAGFDAFVTASEAEPSFKNAMDAACDYEHLDGFTRFTTTGEGDVWLSVEVSIPVAEYKYIAIKYRASSALASNNIYTKDDTGNAGYSAKPGTWVGPGMTADNEWHVRIINVDSEFGGAEGTITGIRIPVVAEVDGTLDFEYIAAFETEDEAKDYVHNETPNTETGVVSILPMLAIAMVTSAGVMKRKKY